jgi:lysophospholipase L1-like esterase
MKQTNLLLIFILFFGHLSFARNWDILDKSMATWNQDGGAPTNLRWAVAQGGSAGSVATQQTGYVNFRKTNTGQSARWAWVRPQTALAALTPCTPYSIEVKARVLPVGIADEGSYFEANQISLRLGSKGIAAPIYLRYGDGLTGGYVSATSGGTSNVYTINTSIWQIYRWVFHPDHSKYDVYIDGVEDPLLENIPVAATGDQDGIYFGAESYHRCHIDVEYVKMGTGAFFSKPKIASVALSDEGQGDDRTKTITATVYTIRIDDNEKLLVSLVDGDDHTVVDAEEAIVSQNQATINFTIPAGLARGKYFVRAAAPDGNISGVDIAPQQAEYTINTSAFEGKNLATFGNSITSAGNSWARQVYKNLRFGNLYNGAISSAVWYKRERTVAGQTIRTQNYYDAGFAGTSSSAPTGNDVLQHQKYINNCAVVHLQKYFTETDKNTAPPPDVIIFSYGTNDDVAYMGDAPSALQEEDLSKVDLFNIAGALKWSLDTLKRRFPDAAIYVALPLQSTLNGKNAGNLQKISVLKAVCDARSVAYFDCYNESGITVENHATYLSDGLHPNEAGKVLHGAYITKKLEEAADNASGLPFVWDGAAGKELIYISTRMLHAGGKLSVESLAEGSPLSEITVYNVAGNEVYRPSVSGNKHTFQAPSASGIYLLRVSLADKTSRTFKVIVK